MPVFLDVHKVPFTESQLKEICKSPVDEFGVSHVNLLYNKDVGICFCLLEGPDIDATEKHHSKVDIKCEWITEVSLAAPFLPPSLLQEKTTDATAAADGTKRHGDSSPTPSLQQVKKAQEKEGWNLPEKD